MIESSFSYKDQFCARASSRLSNDKKYISIFAVIYYDVIIWYLISVNFVPSECPVCSIYAPSAYYNYSCVRISLLDQGFRDSLAPAGGSLSTSILTYE